MSIHTLIVGTTPIDAFTNATPSITAGSELYVQNISNHDVLVSDDIGMANAFVLGNITTKPSISTMSISAGSTMFVQSSDYKSVLTIEVL